MLKVICNQKDLVKAIGESQKAVSNKTTMDILKNFYIQAFNGSLKITGYDLEISIESMFDTNVIEEGEALINAKLFGDIIKKLPQSDIELSVDGDILTLICGKSKFQLKCENAVDYPKLPTANKNNLVEINQGLFKQMIHETVFATSQDQTKPVLTGELLEIKDSAISLVAIDGYRLSVSTNKVSNSIEDSAIVIPSKTLQDVSSLLTSNNDTFKFGFNEKHAMFIVGNTTVVSRLIDGNFIEYKKLLPKEHNTLITANRKELLTCIERASLLTASERNSLVKLEIRDNILNIMSNTDKGNCNEQMNISLSGDYLDIAFNSRYLAEALKVIETEEVTLEFTNNVNPCIIKPVSKDLEIKEYTYLILPVRISSNA